MSKLFVIFCKDKPDSLDLRMTNRPAHLEFARGFGERLKLAGPILTEKEGSPCGSLVVIEGESVEEVEGLLKQDPYCKAGLFQSTEVRPWLPVAGDWLPGEERQL